MENFMNIIHRNEAEHLTDDSFNIVNKKYKKKILCFSLC